MVKEPCTASIAWGIPMVITTKRCPNGGAAWVWLIAAHCFCFSTTRTRGSDGRRRGVIGGRGGGEWYDGAGRLRCDMCGRGVEGQAISRRASSLQTDRPRQARIDARSSKRAAAAPFVEMGMEAQQQQQLWE